MCLYPSLEATINVNIRSGQIANESIIYDVYVGTKVRAVKLITVMFPFIFGSELWWTVSRGNEPRCTKFFGKRIDKVGGWVTSMCHFPLLFGPLTYSSGWTVKFSWPTSRKFWKISVTGRRCFNKPTSHWQLLTVCFGEIGLSPRVCAKSVEKAPKNCCHRYGQSPQ